jgi:hypothetical protein
MALSQSVKRFFIDRINKVIDEKIGDQMNSVDITKVDEKSFSLLLSDTGIEKEFAEYEKISKEIDILNKKEKELHEKMGNVLMKTIGTQPVYYHKGEDFIDDLKNIARTKLNSKAMDELYPEKGLEIERLNALKPDVEGAVLLSTTEPNLRYALTRLLQKYGGDLSAIENMLPEDMI